MTIKECGHHMKGKYNYSQDTDLHTWQNVVTGT